MTADGYSLESTLDGLASTLRTAGTVLGGVGTPPPAPNAGEVSGDIAMLMVAFTDSAAELVLGVSIAGDNVAAGSETYLSAEQAAEQNLSAVR